MKYLLVAVIMGMAVGGTVSALKLIHEFFPKSDKNVEKAEKWIKEHK